ncbi:IreB family regulatory phosphoprotein [Clostridiaceae bacterium HSG29]|nr:IreB family regulatory phosphoprotein [Clostridiaceae bacterium HSG29]
MDKTKAFDFEMEEYDAKKVLLHVFKALEEKGYSPLNQLTGYLISGDPTYITTHNDARRMIRKVFRDKLIEELITSYMSSEE